MYKARSFPEGIKYSKIDSTTTNDCKIILLDIYIGSPDSWFGIAL